MNRHASPSHDIPECSLFSAFESSFSCSMAANRGFPSLGFGQVVQSFLDLTGKWPAKAKASANINSGPRPKCRRWSSTIYESYPHLMGLYYASSMNGNEPAVTLYERVTEALPHLPVLNRPLSDAPLLTPIERIAAELGYDPI